MLSLSDKVQSQGLMSFPERVTDGVDVHEIKVPTEHDVQAKRGCQICVHCTNITP